MKGIKFFDKEMLQRANKEIKEAVKDATFKEYWPKWKKFREKYKKNK